MKFIVTFFALALALHAQDKPTNLTVTEQEQLSRVVIRLQQAQLQIKDIQQEYSALVSGLAVTHKAAGCSLSIDKEWVNCPKPETKKQEPQPK